MFTMLIARTTSVNVLVSILLIYITRCQCKNHILSEFRDRYKLTAYVIACNGVESGENEDCNDYCSSGHHDAGKCINGKCQCQCEYEEIIYLTIEFGENTKKKSADWQ